MEQRQVVPGATFLAPAIFKIDTPSGYRLFLAEHSAYLLLCLLLLTYFVERKLIVMDITGKNPDRTYVYKYSHLE